jgi:hypothetical protein
MNGRDGGGDGGGSSIAEDEAAELEPGRARVANAGARTVSVKIYLKMYLSQSRYMMY